MTVNMQRVTIDVAGRDRKFAYEYDTVVDGDGDWVMIPEDVSEISVALIASDGIGKVQTTTDEYRKVLNDEPLEVVDWPYGEISTSCYDVVNIVTAIRAVAVSGSVRFRLRAQ